jgi:hypothetical protein
MRHLPGILGFCGRFLPNLRAVRRLARRGGWLGAGCCLSLSVAQAQPAGTFTAGVVRGLETRIVRTAADALRDTTLDQKCRGAIVAFTQALESASALALPPPRPGTPSAARQPLGPRLAASQSFLAANLRGCDTLPVTTLIGEAQRYRAELNRLLEHVRYAEAQPPAPPAPVSPAPPAGTATAAQGATVARDRTKPAAPPPVPFGVKVVDTAGRAIRGDLAVYRIDTAFAYPGTSADSAGYLGAPLPPGRYRVRATAAGYHPSDSGVTVAAQPVRLLLPLLPATDRLLAGATVPATADFIRHHAGWVALLGLLVGLSLVSVMLHVGTYTHGALAARKKRFSSRALAPAGPAKPWGLPPDDLLREVNRNVSQLNASLQSGRGGTPVAAAVPQGVTASIPPAGRYFLSEIMMTAGPRKKFVNEPDADRDLGEDVCGLVAGAGHVSVWVLDGTSDLHCMRNPADGREYFSSRLLAQGVANQLRTFFAATPARPLEEMVTRAIEAVRADWLVAINGLPEPEQEALRRNIKAKNFPECASTLLVAQLTLGGEFRAYRSGDSKLVLYADAPDGRRRAIATPLAGKNEAANDRIFFRLLLDAHDQVVIQMNQPQYELVAQQHVAALVAFSDGIGAATEQLLKNEYETGPAAARSELMYQLQGTADDKSICFVEIRESEPPPA